MKVKWLRYIKAAAILTVLPLSVWAASPVESATVLNKTVYIIHRQQLSEVSDKSNGTSRIRGLDPEKEAMRLQQLQESPKPLKTSGKAVKPPVPVLSDAVLNQLQEKNQGRLAEAEDTIYTTAPVIPATFFGFNNQEAVEAVLQALSRTQSRGTFFVTEKDLKRHTLAVDEVVQAGQDIGICIVPGVDESVFDICNDIERVHQAIQNRYGIDARLVRQYSGVIRPETKEAVSMLGYRLIGAKVNAVQSKHKAALTVDDIMPDIFGKSVTAMSRGGILNIRMDYYLRPTLAAELFMEIKIKKIDPIAYNCYGDVQGLNPSNDSAYRICSVSDVLRDETHLWQYPVPASAYLPEIHRYPLLSVGANHDEVINTLAARYIGNPDVTSYERTLGLTGRDFKKLNIAGCIKTKDPVIFFLPDDWGMDDSVNHLLYVFRKHHVHTTFFMLSHNITNNPNLLRAIAADGHDIACHTDSHIPMVSRDINGRQYSKMSYEEFYRDIDTAYKKLESIVGDMRRPDGRPSLTKYFRPPTLAISYAGAKALLMNGYTYIINGSASPDDFSVKDLQTEIKRLKDGIYYHGKVRNRAVFVIHMTESAKYTATALDILLTENEKKQDGDPTKFRVAPLSEYLTDGYSQAKTPKEIRDEHTRPRWW